MKTMNFGIKLMAASLMLLPFASNAQKNVNYKVVKVQGEIQRVKTGNLLSIGEDVANNENFSFKTNYSRAVVVNKDKGCVILSARNDNEGSQFLPSPNNMSVRAALPTQPSEVVEYYYGDVFVSGFDSLKIDDSKLLINDDSYFTVKYSADGKDFTEKLGYKNGKLALPASLLENKPEKATLCYNDEFGESNKSEFTPVYADKETLKGELELIFSTMKGKRNEKVLSSATFVNDFYGKTTEEAVDAWIKNNMNK
ncbi:MAG: hypothetical protein IKO46_00575 [Salinivirgaceae bacterium]|nr:hypothetical protein [Salinivirgaceae bacterium]